MKVLVSKNSICAYLLAASLILSSNPAYTFDLPSLRTTALTAGGLFLVISAIKLHKKKSEPQFTPRYLEDVEKIRAKKPLTFKEIGRFIYHLYDDGFVGQTSCSSKVKANKDDRSLEWSESCNAYGVLGNATEFIRPLKSAAETLGVGLFMYKLARSDKFAEALFGVVNDKAKI